MATQIYRKKLLCRSKTILQNYNFCASFFNNKVAGNILIRASSNNVIINDNSKFSDCLQSSFADVKIPNVSLPELVFEKFDVWHNKIATVCSVTGRKYTYEDVRLKSRNLGKAFLQKLKLNKGDVAAIFLPNVPEYPIIFCAGFMSGIVLTTLNPSYTPDEICKQLVDSDAKVIFTLNSTFECVSNAAKLAKKNIPIITIKTEETKSIKSGSVNFQELINSQYDKSDFVLPNPNDIAVMPYSSGTTGLPKGVELTHKNLVANITQLSSSKLFAPTTETNQDVSPVVLPMFHIYGLTVLTLLPLSCGLKLVTLPQFLPDVYTSVLRDHRASVLFIVPPIVNFMISSPLMKREYFEPLQVVFSGAAPLGALDEEKFLQKAQKDINMIQGYGMTETSPVVSVVNIDRKKMFNKMGSVGDPLPNTEVKIVNPDDNTGKHLKSYENGELWIKGPQVMKGYHNKPEQTAETMAGEWFKSGDLAHYDEDNFIYITDRLKELIKVKGFQVAPAELEELLRNHPELEDVAVIGIPHEQYGEVPRAYVVSKNAKKIHADHLNEYLSSKVTDYKLLRGGVVVLNAIPKNSSGKILRKELKKMYETEKI